MKIKPLKYKLSESAFKSVNDNVKKDARLDLDKWKKKSKTSTFVMITDNPPEMSYMTPVVYNNEIFGSLIPSPPSLFFEQARVHSRNVDELIKQFPDNVEITFGKDTESEFKMINSDLFNLFLIYKISSITSLIMTVESFINSTIPENFKIENNKSKIIEKEEIERKWDLKSKIKEIIPKVISINDLNEYQKKYSKVIELNYLRNEFIHLKTKYNEKNSDPFIQHFETMINLDLNKRIDEIKDFVNFIRPNYLE